MSLTCSIMIPTRRRFERLKKAIQSFQSSAVNQSSFEFLVRFDDDDDESKSRHRELSHVLPVKCFWGPRPPDWQSAFKLLWNELAEKSSGEWLWSFSDDMVVEGSGWDEKLGAVGESFWVQPNMHRLGASNYPNDKGGPVPLIRKSFWIIRKFPLIDYVIWEHATAAGLALKWLDGIAVHHQRDNDDTLTEHRKHP